MTSQTKSHTTRMVLSGLMVKLNHIKEGELVLNGRENARRLLYGTDKDGKYEFGTVTHVLYSNSRFGTITHDTNDSRGAVLTHRQYKNLGSPEVIDESKHYRRVPQ